MDPELEIIKRIIGKYKEQIYQVIVWADKNQFTELRDSYVIMYKKLQHIEDEIIYLLTAYKVKNQYSEKPRLLKSKSDNL